MNLFYFSAKPLAGPLKPASIRRFMMTLLSLWAFAIPAQAAEVTVTWDGGGDGLSWMDAANWDPAAIPDNNLDSYRVVLGPGAFVELTQAATINFLSVAASAELTIDGGGELRVVGAGEGLEATRGIQNNGIVTLGGPLAGAGKILISLSQTFSGNGLFRSAESVSVNAGIGLLTATGSRLFVPAGSALRFGSNSPTLIRGLRIGLDQVKIFGSVTFADLDTLEIVAIQVENNNLMLFQNTLASLSLQQLNSSTGVGVIRVVDELGTTVSNAVISNQDFLITAADIRFSSTRLENISLAGDIRMTGGNTLVSLRAGVLPFQLEIENGTLDLDQAVQTHNLERITSIGFSTNLISPSGLSQNPSITLGGELTLSGNTRLAISVPLDLNGQVLRTEGSATQVQLASGGLEFGGGAVEVNGGSQLTTGVDWTGILGGGVVSVAAGSTLFLGSGVIEQVDFVNAFGNIVGTGGGILRDLRIPSEAKLSGSLRFDGDIVFDGLMNLGSLTFVGSSNTLSGSGEFVYPSDGSMGTISGGFGAPVTLTAGSVMRMTGGQGVLDADLNNLGVLELAAAFLVTERNHSNRGTIAVQSGQFNLESGAVDNTGGVISADGGRLVIGPEDPNDSPVRITGGVLQSGAALKGPTHKGPQSGLFFAGAKLTDVTLTGDATSMAGFDLALQSSLVNQGTLRIERFDGFSLVRVENSDVMPFQLTGGGTIDFGDGSVVSNTANQRMRFEAENVTNVDNTVRGNVSIRNQFGQVIDFINEGTMITSDAIGMGVGFGSFTNRGTLQIDAGGKFEGSVRNEGTLVAAGQLEATQLTQAAGTASIFGEFLGSIVMEGGNLNYDSANGIDNLSLNGGTFPVGGSGIGPTNVNFTFGMGPDASIAFDLGGLQAELEYDILSTNNGGLGSTTYDGSLIIKTANNFTPQPGDVFTIGRFRGPRNGTEFAQVINQTPFPGLNFDIEYTGDFFNFVRVNVSGDPTIVVESDLVVELRQCDRISSPGRTHDYAVVVRNDGPDPASEVQLSIDPPANGTLAASPTLPPDCTQGTLDILCQYPNLAVGESRVVLLAIDIDPGATATTGISASVGALESDPATGNNAASISTTLVNDLVEVDGFESCDG